MYWGIDSFAPGTGAAESIRSIDLVKKRESGSGARRGECRASATGEPGDVRRTALTYLLALAVITWNVLPLKATGSAYAARAVPASSTLTQPGGGPSTAAYDRAGNLVQLVAANGTTQHWGYDQAGQAVGATVVLSGTAQFSQTDTLDAAGERTAEDDTWGRAHAQRGGAFSYDLAGRLIRASYPDGGSEQDQYDGAGNRTIITSTVALLSTPVPATASPTATIALTGTATVTATGSATAYTARYAPPSPSSAISAIPLPRPCSGLACSGASRQAALARCSTTRRSPASTGRRGRPRRARFRSCPGW